MKWFEEQSIDHIYEKTYDTEDIIEEVVTEDTSEPSNETIKIKFDSSFNFGTRFQCDDLISETVERKLEDNPDFDVDLFYKKLKERLSEPDEMDNLFIETVLEDEMKKIKKLRKSGALTEEQFKEQEKMIMKRSKRYVTNVKNEKQEERKKEKEKKEKDSHPFRNVLNNMFTINTKPVTESSLDMMDELMYSFLEAGGKSSLLRDFVYPYIESTFKGKPENVKKFNQIVSKFINKNIEKLTTSGPVYLIPFTDVDKSEYYELFGISEKDIKRAMKEHTKALGSSKFLLLTQNPIFALFYFVIRYFTLHPDKKSLNSALSIYALSNYPSMFTKYFKYGVIEPVMRYTIDNLTDKFLIKKTSHIFGALVESIQRSYQFLKPYMKEGNDDEVVRFIQRIRNDQNSMFRKLSNIYYDNHKKGNAVTTTNQKYDDDTPIIDEVENATTEVQNAVTKVTLPIVSNGVDIIRAEASAKMASIGISDCRFFLTNIISVKNLQSMQDMIESLLFLYLYEEKKTIRDVRSQYFLAWAVSLFKKTNSKNKNIIRINTILNEWAKDSGVYDKFKREASRINYKKAIFFYVVLSIQKYIG